MMSLLSEKILRHITIKIWMSLYIMIFRNWSEYMGGGVLEFSQQSVSLNSAVVI